MEFLERLGKLANCQYLSDLPRIKPGQDVLNKLQAQDLGEYSLQELAEAACYIAGEKRACATREEAVQAIAEAWTKK